MSVTKVLSVDKVRELFTQLSVAPPQLPSDLKEVTLNLFPLKDGSVVGCCKYFNVVLQGDQPLSVKDYTTPKCSVALDCDDDDDDDDIKVLPIVDVKPVVPGSSVITRPPAPVQPVPHQRYKVNQRAIFVGVKDLSVCHFI